jgi:hypothetical protein
LGRFFLLPVKFSGEEWENEDHIGHAWSSALSAKAEDEDEDG